MSFDIEAYSRGGLIEGRGLNRGLTVHTKSDQLYTLYLYPLNESTTIGGRLGVEEHQIRFVKRRRQL